MILVETLLGENIFVNNKMNVKSERQQQCSENDGARIKPVQ